MSGEAQCPRRAIQSPNKCLCWATVPGNIKQLDYGENQAKKKKINPSYIITTTTAKLAMWTWRCCLIMLNILVPHPKSCIVDNCPYMSISLIAHLPPPRPFLLLASLLGGGDFFKKNQIYMPSFNGFFIIVHLKWKSTFIRSIIADVMNIYQNWITTSTSNATLPFQRTVTVGALRESFHLIFKGCLEFRAG